MPDDEKNIQGAIKPDSEEKKAFIKGLLDNHQAARPLPDGSLPPGATLRSGIASTSAAEAFSPAIATALNAYLGYEEVASVVKQSVSQRRTIRDVVVDRGHVRDGRITQEQLDEALDVRRMARPQE